MAKTIALEGIISCSIFHFHGYGLIFRFHELRHTKAMHLLNADVNMFYIRDILGHVDISTTEIYARIDAEKKRAILEKISNNSATSSLPSWREDQSLMMWLKNLAK